MYGITVLSSYAIIMVLATLLLTKRETVAEKFYVGDRRMGTLQSAMSIAATWIWAPALFTSAEKAYANGFVGLFWFLVPNILCLLLFIPFAKRIRKRMPHGISLAGFMGEQYHSEKVKGIYLFQLGSLSVLSTGVQLLAGGKDSLVLAHLVLSLIQQGKIDPSKLTVQFVDEEAIFPCIERTVLDWRKKFLLVGSKFEWYCVEVKHYNCFNLLSEDESFICWDSKKQPVWVRKPPKFAIRTHPLLRPRVDAYQDFMPRVCMDGITITGVRAAESIQRARNIAAMTMTGKNMTNRHQVLPVYDWSNNDVWLYLLENKVEIPDIYLYLWQAGTAKGQLRVSQFFSVDTARSLVKMNEYYPDLMERVIRREPNAYLAALYWDSEMFGRTSKTRRELEKGAEKDYQAMLVDVFNNIDTIFGTAHQKYIAKRYRMFFLQGSSIFDNRDCKKIYEALMKGDPKLRSYRALYQQLYGRYIDNAKKGET